MAHEVKLDVYTLMLKQHGKDTYCGFNELRHLNEHGKEVKMKFTEFFKKYISSFSNRQFHVQESSGKAIYLPARKTKFASEKYTITGLVDGGTTGIGSSIKTRTNGEDEGAFKVLKESVNSIPYYFKLWLPADSNVGLLIIQGLGSKTIGDVFKAHLRSFFSQSTVGTTLVIEEHIPKELEKKVMKNGLLNTIVLRKSHLSSDKAEKILNTQYKDGSNITIEVRISGVGTMDQIKKTFQDVIGGTTKTLINTKPFEEIGMDGTHDTFVQFKYGNQVTTGKVENNFKLSPTYNLSQTDYETNNDNVPTFDSLELYCEKFLEALKKEINK